MEVKTTALLLLQQQVLDHGTGRACAPSTCKIIISFLVCTQRDGESLAKEAETARTRKGAHGERGD